MSGPHWRACLRFLGQTIDQFLLATRILRRSLSPEFPLLTDNRHHLLRPAETPNGSLDSRETRSFGPFFLSPRNPSAGLAGFISACLGGGRPLLIQSGLVCRAAIQSRSPKQAAGDHLAEWNPHGWAVVRTLPISNLGLALSRLLFILQHRIHAQDHTVDIFCSPSQRSFLRAL